MLIPYYNLIKYSKKQTRKPIYFYQSACSVGPKSLTRNEPKFGSLRFFNSHKLTQGSSDSDFWTYLTRLFYRKQLNLFVFLLELRTVLLIIVTFSNSQKRCDYIGECDFLVDMWLFSHWKYSLYGILYRTYRKITVYLFFRNPCRTQIVTFSLEQQRCDYLGCNY